MTHTEYTSTFLISFYTLLKREILRIRKIAIQTVVAPLVSNLLFLGIFGGIFSGKPVEVTGISYLQFIMPGLIFSALTMSAYQNPLFSIMVLKYQDTLRDFALFPISNTGRMMAFAIAGAIRGMIVGFTTYAVAGLFAGWEISYPFQYIIFMFFVSLIFSLGGYLTGFIFSSMEKANFIISLLLSPLIYLSGIFYDISTLPGIWKDIAVFNPFAVLVSLSRVLYFSDIAFSLPVLPVITSLLFYLSIIIASWIITKANYGIIEE